MSSNGVRVMRGLDRFGARLAIHPFLFAAYVVLQLYVNNLGEIPAVDVVLALAVVLAATAVAFGLLTLLYRDARRAGIVTAVSIMVFLGFAYVRSAVLEHWRGDGMGLLAASVVLIGLVAVAAARARSMLSPITQAMNVAALVLFVVALVPIIGYAGDAARIPADLAVARLPRIDTGTPRPTGRSGTPRDIYFVVLDRYGSERALEARFGADNGDFIAWLRGQGFQVVDDARANYVRSTLSLGTTLSMTMLDDVIARIGKDNSAYAPILERLQDSRAAAFLQERGYEYVHIGSWFDPTRESTRADRSLSPDAHVTFASALFDFSALGALRHALLPGEAFVDSHAAAAQFQFEVLDAMADEPGPKFVVAHILLPHSPYVFLADGSVDPQAADFRSQLAYTNARLRDWLEPLLARPEEERPVIILQADEGPYPERYTAQGDGFDWSAATAEEVAIKFGILSALFLPGEPGLGPLPSTLSSVNTFREVLRRYFGAQLPNLPDRSYASSFAHPYDLTELTDRLPGALETTTTNSP